MSVRLYDLANMGNLIHLHLVSATTHSGYLWFCGWPGPLSHRCLCPVHRRPRSICWCPVFPGSVQQSAGVPPGCRWRRGSHGARSSLLWREGPRPKVGLETDVPVEEEEQEGKQGSLCDQYPPSIHSHKTPNVNRAHLLYCMDTYVNCSHQNALCPHQLLYNLWTATLRLWENYFLKIAGLHYKEHYWTLYKDERQAVESSSFYQISPQYLSNLIFV